MQIFLTLKTLLKLFYNFNFPVYKKLSFIKIATEAILKIAALFIKLYHTFF